MSRKEKKQVAKITIFLTSVFVIFLSVTYAFINITLAGTKRHIINAGTLEVELEEENEITIENVFPMYDETGMIQDAFVFHVRNKDELRINYTLRLEDITQSAEKLSTADVKYGLKKGDEVTIDLLSNLENGVIEEGSLGKKETATYELRLWIRDDLTENEELAAKSLTYRIAVDVTGMVESDGPVIELLSDLIAGSPTYLLEGKVTDESRIETVLVNGEVVELSEDGTFSKDLTLLSGNNEVKIYAKDMWGNETEETYTIVYDVASPNLVVNTPASSSSSSPTFTTSPSYAVSGTVSDASGIKSVTVNGQAATLTGNNWSYNLALSANTTTTVTVVATDNVGKTSTITRYVHYDNSAPNLTVTAPTSTNSSSPTYTTSASYTVKGTVSDASGIKSVTVNGSAATVSGNSWSRAISLSANTRTTVTIVATDNAGRTTTQTRYVFYDSAAPSLAVSAPASTSSSSPTYTSSLTYTVSGTVSDATGIASVTVNGSAASVSGNSWSKAITLSPGQTTTVTIVARDRVGRTTTVTRYVNCSPTSSINYLYLNGQKNYSFETSTSWNFAILRTDSHIPFYVGAGKTVTFYVYVESITGGTGTVGYTNEGNPPAPAGRDYYTNFVSSKQLSVGWNTLTFSNQSTYIYAGLALTSNQSSADSENSISFGSTAVTLKTKYDSMVVKAIGYKVQ